MNFFVMLLTSFALSCIVFLFATIINTGTPDNPAGIPPLDEIFNAGIVTVIIIGTLTFVSQVVFKSKTIGIVLGILLAIVSHPVFDIVGHVAIGNQFSQAMIDFTNLITQKFQHLFAFMFFVCAIYYGIRNWF